MTLGKQRNLFLAEASPATSLGELITLPRPVRFVRQSLRLNAMVFPLTNVCVDVNLRQTSQREAFCDAGKAPKSIFDRGSAPDPVRKAHDAPQTT